MMWWMIPAGLLVVQGFLGREVLQVRARASLRDGVALAEGRRRCVGSVGIEVVSKEEQALLRANLVHVLQHGAGHVLRAALILVGADR